ncbi:MAG: hypothetical protein R6T98_14235 [Desulfatiglandales bacterium]
MSIDIEMRLIKQTFKTQELDNIEEKIQEEIKKINNYNYPSRFLLSIELTKLSYLIVKIFNFNGFKIEYY